MMADQEENPPQLEKLRSHNSSHRAFARFCNKTSRNMSLEWLDFQGDHVSYGERIPPEGTTQMNTFVGHPWLFYETECRHPLVTRPGDQSIYFPVGWDYASQPSYDNVNIVNPLLTLEKSCLQFLHRYIAITCGHGEKDVFKRKVDQLALPRNVAASLKKLDDDRHDRNIPVLIVPQNEEEEEG